MNAFPNHEERTLTKSRAQPQAPTVSSRTWLFPEPFHTLEPTEGSRAPALLVDAGTCLQPQAPKCKDNVAGPTMNNVINK